MAVGVPADPAPTMMTSLVFKMASFVFPGQYSNRNLDKQGPVGPIRYRIRINAFFLKDSPDHRPAGL
jgi:hypothetical protein